MKLPTTKESIQNLVLPYQDQHLFVVCKPSGLHSVKIPREGGASVAELLLLKSPALAEVGEKEGDAGLLNRLDLETSGVLLGAKSKSVYAKLRALLHDGAIHKTYIALCDGEFAQIITVRGYLGSPNRRAKKVRVYDSRPSSKMRALDATTDYKLIRYLSEKDASLVEAHAPTARRHQIRAHAAHAGHPLCGDALYGSGRALCDLFETEASAHELPKFFLHALAIRFAHPVTGDNICVTAPPPVWVERISSG